MGVVLLEMKGPVAWVWLNRPRRLNAIDEALLAELGSAFETACRSAEVRAIVLAAHGLVFSAGFDIEWMVEKDAGTMVEGLDEVCALYDAIESCAKPVIAAVQGAAMGGGLLLALVADYCLASESAAFGTPEVKVGMLPALQLVPRLVRAVGIGAAKRLLLSGDPLDAREAQRIGLAQRVVPAESLISEAQRLAEQIARFPPAAVQSTKAAFAAAQMPGYSEWEKAQFATCWQLPERQAAMRAFLKR
jgi:enoyl-CoA hydratase/carnithine racemase